MPRYLSAPTGFSHDTPPRLGVLLTNLGTPAQPSSRAVRRYLAQFLADPRVVEIPRPLWRLILHGIILRTRPRRSAQAYQQIWTEQGSPLLVHSRAQADALHTALGQRLHGPFSVALGMRYGEPSIPQALRRLQADNARRIIVLPLYPQYSATTTASTFDAVARELGHWRWQPELRAINGYHAAPGYINALAASIKDHWQQQGRGGHLLFSFHGLPQRNLELGDPYFCFCQKTARLTAEKLQLADDAWSVCFQSRLGRAQWLQPYADARVRELAAEGIKNLGVISPGFAADCLETLEELAIRNAGYFKAAGGENLRYIPALNARDDHINFLADLVVHHSQGWPETSPLWKKATLAATLDETRQRASSLGAKR